MARKKFSIDYSAFEGLYDELDKLNGDLKGVTEKALLETKKEITPNIETSVRKHRRTGKTEKSLDNKLKVEWQKFTASVDIGFNIKEGGLPSIFLMYGTPRHEVKIKKTGRVFTHPGMIADDNLYNSIYGESTAKRATELQKDIILGEISERMGSGNG